MYLDIFVGEIKYLSVFERIIDTKITRNFAT